MVDHETGAWIFRTTRASMDSGRGMGGWPQEDLAMDAS